MEPKIDPKCLLKPTAGASLSTWKGHQKSVTEKDSFLRPVLFGRFAVFEAMDLEMGPQLYIYIYIYTRIFARASRALDSPWHMTLSTTMSLSRPHVDTDQTIDRTIERTID